MIKNVFQPKNHKGKGRQKKKPNKHKSQKPYKGQGR